MTNHRARPHECGQLIVDGRKRRRSGDLRVGDAVHGHCRRRNRQVHAHEALENPILADTPAAQLDGADLDHPGAARIEAGRLRVEDDRFQGEKRRIPNKRPHRREMRPF
jgi:hypothetical protein